MPGRSWGLVPYLVVALVAAVILMLGGASPGELVRYLAYELSFVMLPGILATQILLPRLPSVLLRLTIGAAIGLALELAAFIALARLGLRPVFAAYPLVVVAAWLLITIIRRRAGWANTRNVGDPIARQLPSTSFCWHMSVGAIALLACGFAAISLFSATPPVTATETPVYSPDLVFHLSLAAELTQRMPPTVPQVAGLPLVYHWFANAHLAAVSSISGVELWPLVSRLFPLVWIPVVVIQVATIASAISGRRWAGPLAAALVFVCGELDLSLGEAIPFNGTLRTNLWSSPSFLYSLTLFVPLLLLLAPGVGRAIGTSGAKRWIAAGLLAAACVGAKATILPVLVGGTVLSVLFARRWSPRLIGSALVATAIVAGTFLVGLATLYAGGETGFIVQPTASVTRTAAWDVVVGEAPEVTSGLTAVVLGAAMLVALLAPVAGTVLFRPRQSVVVRQMFLLGILAAGVGAYLTFNHPGASQLYFLHYGVVAGAMLAAWSLADVPRWPRPGGLRRGWVMAGGLVVAMAGVTSVMLPPSADGDAELLPFALPYAVLLVGSLLLVAPVALLAPVARHRTVALALVGVVMAAAALDAPLDLGLTVGWVTEGTSAGQEEIPVRHGITPELLAGLAWIRDETEADAIVAVNNQYEAHGRNPRSFLVSGFGGRRVYLEGWLYTQQGQRAAAMRLDGHSADEPFAARRATNAAAFQRADPAAMAELRAAGVDYLFVDRWAAAMPLDVAGALVFENEAVLIYALADGS